MKESAQNVLTRLKTARNGESIRTLSEKYVAECFGSSDWYSLLDGVFEGFDTMSNLTPIEIAKGTHILSAINSELTQRHILVKRLFPVTSNNTAPDYITHTDVIYVRLNEIFQHVKQKIEFPPKIDAIQNFLDWYAVQLRTQKEKKHPENSVILFAHDISRNGVPAKTMETLGKYEEVFSTLVGFVDTDADPQAVRDNVLDSLIRNSDDDPYNPMNVAIGGVTMGDILSGRYETTEALSEAMFAYISHMPKGDLYWNLMRYVFLFPPHSNEMVKPTHPEALWNIMLFQKWMTEKLIFPAYWETNVQQAFGDELKDYFMPDAVFNEQFARIIDLLDEREILVIVKYFYLIMTRGPKFMHEIDSSVSIENAVKAFPLVDLAVMFDPQQAETGMIVVSRVIHKMLASQWGRVSTNWYERFSHAVDNKSSWEQFMRLFESQVHMDIDADQSNMLNTYLHQRMGETFVEMMTSHASELDRTNQIMWDEMREVDYWLNSDVSHRIDFSLDSLAEILGFSSAIFTAGDSKHSPVGVFLELPNESFGLSGRILPDGSIYWNFKAEHVEQGVVLLMNYIVTSAFRDLVKYGGIKDVKRSGALVRQTSDDDQKDSAHTRRHRRRSRHAPRMRSRIVPSNTEYIHIESKQLILEIEQDATRRHIKFTPRHVDPFKRYFSNLDAYVQAEYAFRNADDGDRDRLWMELLEARSQIRQPSLEKIAMMDQLPERFCPPKLLGLDGTELTDVLQGRVGITMYQATWVRQFVSPKETDEEKRDASIRYNKWYKHASAMAFDGEIKNWIVGLDRAAAETIMDEE